MSAQQQSKVSLSHMQTMHRPIEPSDTSLSARFYQAKKFINAALEYANGSHSIDDIFQIVVAGDAQFWATEEAALVTEIIDYPRKRTLRFWLAGGNLDSLRGAREGRN